MTAPTDPPHEDMNAIGQRLGGDAIRERIDTARPFKPPSDDRLRRPDLNETLQAHGGDAVRQRMDAAEPYVPKAKPRDGNDILREEGVDAVRDRFDAAKPYVANGNSEKPASKSGEAAKTLPLLPLLRWSQIVLTAMAGYLVQGLIPRTGLTVVYGPPKCGKTFFIFDLVMQIALGWCYRGRRTEKGKVVYCLFEGQRPFAKRKEAFHQRHLAEDHEEPAFFLMPVRIGLVKDHQRLIDTIIALAGGDDVAVVVLDTLNRSFSGSESNDEAMTAYIAACDAIEAALGCAVILVHHSGLTEGRLRGHTSLLGSAACQIAVKRDAADNVVATVEFMKDDEAGEEIVSRLEQVTVGKVINGEVILGKDFVEDDDGEVLRSCVVLPFDGPAVKTEPAKRAERALSPNAQSMFDLLLEAGAKGLTNAEWFARCLEIGIAERRKANFFDIRRTLQKRNLIMKGQLGWFAKR